jgi:hypothetical protein
VSLTTSHRQWSFGQNGLDMLSEPNPFISSPNAFDFWAPTSSSGLLILHLSFPSHSPLSGWQGTSLYSLLGGIGHDLPYVPSSIKFSHSSLKKTQPLIRRSRWVNIDQRVSLPLFKSSQFASFFTSPLLNSISLHPVWRVWDLLQSLQHAPILRPHS